MRFCFVPPGSLTPRRFRCVPDDDASRRAAALHVAALRRPRLRAAAQRDRPRRSAHGADDEGEMGVMHALFQPQRETNLRIRLDEYLRFGLHAGIFYAT